MTSQAKLRFSTAVAAILILSACQAGDPAVGDNGDTIVPTMTGATPAGRDVESPDVFSLTGAGLWDGRPSLGGVWVAHSSVIDPERVLIRNPANGKSVVGALFRRERETPGPSVQVSSDAAEALGMLAGQPADLSVVALRREEVAPPAAAPAPVETTSTENDNTVAETTETSPAIAGEGAAAAAAPQPVVAPERKSGGFFGLFRKKPKPEPVISEPVASGTATGEIEATPLDPIASTAAAAIERADPAPAAQPSAELKRPYVQIGIFSTVANAERAASQMNSAGMTATIMTDGSQGKTYWRVIVGPAASVAERDALASRVKGIGYPDAYPVSQ